MLLNTLKGECIQPESNGIPDTFIGCPYYPEYDKRTSSCGQSTPPPAGIEKHSVACFLEE
jgi:hypothetical protein